MEIMRRIACHLVVPCIYSKWYIMNNVTLHNELFFTRTLLYANLVYLTLYSVP